MSRYETLKLESQMTIDCLMPEIAANFGVKNVTEVVPADICMRAWDCERREHIYSQPEQDARNWGLQFVKNLGTISRMKKVTLEEFQRDLREKVEAHKEEHPWARLADINEVMFDYLHPERKNPPPVEESEEIDSDNSYYELVETGQPRRGRDSDAPMFEARPVPKKKKSKHAPKRLRRGSSEGWGRKDKCRRSATLPSDGDDSTVESSLQQEHAPTPGYKSKRDLKKGSVPNKSNAKYDSFDEEDLDAMSVSELEAHVQLREAELRAARVKVKLAEIRRKRKRRSTQSLQPSMDTDDYDAFVNGEQHSVRQSSMDTRGSDAFMNGVQHNIRQTTEGATRAKPKPARHRNLVRDDESDSEMPAAVPTRKPVGRSITSIAKFGEEEYEEYDAEEESDRRYPNGRIADVHKRHPKAKVSRPIADSRKTRTPAQRVRTPSLRRETPVSVAKMVPPPQLTVKRKPTYLPKAYMPTATVAQESDEDHECGSTNEHSSENLPDAQKEKIENTERAGEESPLFTPEE